MYKYHICLLPFVFGGRVEPISGGGGGGGGEGEEPGRLYTPIVHVCNLYQLSTIPDNGQHTIMSQIVNIHIIVHVYI